jgi:hypothetical protein
MCVLVLVMALVLSGSAFAKEKKPDASLKLSEGQVARCHYDRHSRGGGSPEELGDTGFPPSRE